jgi:hypothetical protein
VIKDYQDWFTQANTIMSDIVGKGVFPTQQGIDKLYETLITHIQRSQNKGDPQNRTRRPKKKAKRKKKRYAYGRYQELYKMDPSTLAKHIREGTPWLEDKKPNINAQIIGEFYTKLWGTKPEINIPFEYVSSPTNESIEEETLRAISEIEIKIRMNHMKNKCPRTR